MANSDKNILITPNTGSSSANPIIRFTGANNTPLSLRVLDSGTLSFEGTAGQLFSISDGLTGIIYSVNDISGMPSIELLDTGLLKLNQYSGSTVFGAAAAIQSSSVNAKVSISTAFATTPGLIVRGVTSQSASLQEWQSSGGSPIASISSTGGANFTGSVNVGAGSFIGTTIQESNQSSSTITMTTLASNTINTGAVRVRPRGATGMPLIVQGANTSGAITAATANGTTITYTSNVSVFIVAGQSVTITGVVSTGNAGATAGSGFNLTAATVASASGTQFTVTNSLVDTYTSGGALTVTHSADLTQWQNNAGSILARVNPSGNITAASYITTGGTASQFVRGDGTLTTAQIPQNAQTSAYTAALSDVGKHISITTGGVTIPASIFGVGDNFMIYNNSASSQTITQGSGVTLRLSGTASFGNRTLSQHGLATVVCVAAGVFVIAGTGLA